MAYKIERFNDLPMILSIWDADFSVSNDLITYNTELATLLDAETHPVYHIVDMREVKMTFTDVMSAIQIGVKGEQATANHPNIRQIVVVTHSRMINMAAKGLNTMSFGNIDMAVFETVEDAVGYVRQKAS